ncbi:MAG: serine/threonine-protein kinase [Planctomycetota bacterium]
MTDTSQDTLFGRLAVELNLCTEEELQQGIDLLKAYQAENPMPIEEALIKLGYITQSQARRLRENVIETKETKAAAHQIPGYKILGKVGAGAMAVVYKAKQLSLDRIVAIKVLPRKFTEKADYVERFYKEGRAAAMLNHNNIVQAIDVNEAGGYHYFVMEYVEGKTIYEMLSAGRIFKEGEAIDIVIQVAEALKHAHARGLIHRDIKPKNIIITPSNVVKLADMGLARETADIATAQSEAGKAYGTPYYIAPEQVMGKIDIDGRADIYSLGATFYHMVTGRLPFESTKPSEVMRMHVKEALTPPDHINTSLSAGVSEVIETMMAKKRDDRYNNADELLADLRGVREGQPPLIARRKFNLENLDQLEDADTVDMETDERVYDEQTVTRYRVAIMALIATVVILGLVIILMMAQ